MQDFFPTGSFQTEQGADGADLSAANIETLSAKRGGAMMQQARRPEFTQGRRPAWILVFLFFLFGAIPGLEPAYVDLLTPRVPDGSQGRGAHRTSRVSPGFAGPDGSIVEILLPTLW